MTPNLQAVHCWIFLKLLEFDKKLTRQSKRSNQFVERTLFPLFLLSSCSSLESCLEWTYNMWFKYPLKQLSEGRLLSAIVQYFFLYVYVDVFLPVIWCSSYKILFKL